MEQNFFYYMIVHDGQWNIRVDQQLGDGRHHQRHVHVTRKGLKGEYSWNVDGTRHDKSHFPASEEQIGKARELASKALNVPMAKLQFITMENGGNFVSIESVGRERRVFSMYIRVKEQIIIFGTSEGGIVILVMEYNAPKNPNNFSSNHL